MARDYLGINGFIAGFPLPKPTTTFLMGLESAANRLIYDETHYDVQRLNAFLSGKRTMNKGQAAAF